MIPSSSMERLPELDLLRLLHQTTLLLQSPPLINSANLLLNLDLCLQLPPQHHHKINTLKQLLQKPASELGQGYTENDIRLRNRYTDQEEKQKHQKLFGREIPAEIIIPTTEDSQYERVTTTTPDCIKSRYNKDKEKGLQPENVGDTVSLARYRKDHEDLTSQLSEGIKGLKEAAIKNNKLIQDENKVHNLLFPLQMRITHGFISRWAKFTFIYLPTKVEWIVKLKAFGGS